MLKKSVTELVHPCFGKIRFNEKFSKILELKPFCDLAFKSQLGTKSLSRKFVNAKHTRLTHSIGVYYLTSLLLKTCKDKFSNYIEISSQDEEALLLAALGHDIGHLAFSHSLEIKEMKSHEEMTIELFEKYCDEIDEIFGYDIVSKVIQIFKNNIKVKQQGTDGQADEELDILFIFSSLLVGTIDCDRMEYIITDRYMVTGEKLDFTSIFDYITIVLLNNAPTVGFEREAIPVIENLLTNRFEQYEQIYFDEDSTLIEIALKDFVKEQSWNFDEVSSYTEYGILYELHNILSCPKEAGSVNSRLSEIILLGNRKNILFKKFISKDEFDFFMDKINSIVDDRIDLLWIKTEHKTNCIYKPNKNKVYIKDNDGVVKDITEVSLKITDLKVDYYYVMIDLALSYIDVTVSKNLKSLFNDNAVEIEKKFVLKQNISVPENISYAEIFDKISKISGISFENEFAKTVNYDQYYIPSVEIPTGMAIRLRKNTSGDCFFIKLSADDGTSITKRDEQPFPNCSSLEEFVELAEKFILLKGYHLSGKLILTEGIKVTTKRIKILSKVYDSIIEFAFDNSEYEYNGVTKKDYMLECELKQGDDLSLWYLSKHLRELGFVETNESKETRAKKALGVEID